jgi:hypothetical protein
MPRRLARPRHLGECHVHVRRVGDVPVEPDPALRTDLEPPPARPEHINSRGPGHRASGTAVLPWAILSAWLRGPLTR